MTTSDPQTTKLRHLRERWQRLDDLARRMQDQYDRETRVEEKARLEPLIKEKENDRGQVESEIRKLETLPNAAPKPPCLFYSYAHEDEPLRDQLAKHLKLLERQGILSSWHDRALAPGTDWDQEISQQLLDADILLLLVSADFLASDYIWSKELKIALDRHQKREARVIPIILRPCDWTHAPFAHLQALPRDARPVTKWPDRDEAFTAIAQALRELATVPQ